MRTVWALTRDTVNSFLDNGGLSRGAAIAFYAITSIGPVLLIIVAVAGLVLGEEAARGALMGKLEAIMGAQAAGFLQSAIGSASNHGAGVIATIVGIVSLIITASGVFGEMQTALNVIWRAQPEGDTVGRLVRARLTSLGLVVALGFLLLVSLVLGTAVAAVGQQLNRIMPFSELLLHVLNSALSLAMLAVVVAAVYKVLPDCSLRWRDVLVGSVVTALLITIGKLAIGIYIGHTALASSYGAAGSVLAALFWVYYSAQIFLLGAEFTRVYADARSARRHRGVQPVPASASARS
ncbi:MAG: YihY/virulence factor BrkB family protein [Rhodospirillales bacterium]|nr:YihY/virulence factor BrkB family protein [Rhodospirillales bacterium]